MAIDSTITCIVCGKRKQVTHSAGSYPDTCDDCKEDQADTARRDFLLSRLRLSVEERLALIERDIYGLSERANRPSWDGRIG